MPGIDTLMLLIVSAAVTVASVVALRSRTRPARLRRALSGALLIALGLVLGCSQVSTDPARLALGLALVAAWAGVGLGVSAGRARARWAGLALALIGTMVALWGTTQAGPGGDLLLVHAFFTVRGDSFAWIDVGAGLWAFAWASVAAGALLILPISAGRQPTDAPKAPEARAARTPANAASQRRGAGR